MVVVVDAITLHRPLAAGQVVVLRAATVAAQEQQIKALQAVRAAAALTAAVVVMYAGEVIESGATAEVLGRPFHPYTMGLYRAFPDLHGSGGTLVPIEGSPPNLISPPEGCSFADRCPFVEPRCRAERPPLLDVASGSRAACWRVSEADALRVRAGEAETWLRS